MKRIFCGVFIAILLSSIAFATGIKIEKIMDNFFVVHPHQLHHSLLLTEQSNGKLSIFNIDNYNVFDTGISLKGVSYLIMDKHYVCGVKDWDQIMVANFVEKWERNFQVKRVAEGEDIFTDYVYIWRVIVKDNHIYAIAAEYISKEPSGEEITDVIVRLIKLDINNGHMKDIYNRKYSPQYGVIQLYGPLFVNNQIIITDLDRIIKVDAATSKITQTVKIDNPVYSELLIDNNILYFATNKELYAIDTDNFEVVWKTDYFKRNKDYVAIQPIIFKDKVFIGTTYETFTGQPGQDRCAFSAYDKKTGKLMWKDICKGELDVIPIVYNNKLLFSTYNYDKKMYRVLYGYDINGKKVFDPFVCEPGGVFFVNSKNELLLFGNGVYKANL